MPATPENLKQIEIEKAREAKAKADLKARAETLAEKISSLSLTLEMLVGETDKPFGAVTVHDIQQALSKQGVTLEKKDIHLEEPIKQLGAHQIDIKLNPEIHATLKLSVVKKK